MRTFGGSKLALTAGFMTLLAGTSLALGDIPAAMDRVPADAPIIIAVRDMAALRARVEGFAKQVQLPMPPDGMKEVDSVLKTEGLNASGSLALAITPPKGGGMNNDRPKIVAIVPVTNAAALIKSLKGDPTEKIATVTMPGEGEDHGYVKDIGGGYIAIADTKETVEAFNGTAGSNKSHAAALGETGRRVADSSDFLLIANIPQMKDMMEKGVAEMKETMEGVAAMAGEQGEQMASAVKMLSSVADAFIKDGQVGIVGANIDDKGVNIDLATNFKEGSKSAGYFSAKSNAAALTSRLPAGDFLLAGSFDWSSAGIKGLIRETAAMGDPKAGPGSVMGIHQWAKLLDVADGQAMFMGASDLGSGLLTNSCYIISGKDSAKLGEAYKSMVLEMNGVKNQGVTTKVEYASNAKEVAGTKVNTYSMSFDADPNDPSAAGMQMVMPMIFGPEGKMAGYTVATGNAFIGTMSMNSELLQRAMESSKSGKGLGEDPLVRQTAQRLPADRSGDFYIGVKAMMDTMMGFMAMMGQAPEVQVPEKLAPVGLGLTTHGGGAQLRIHVPADVIKTITGLQKSFKGGADEEAEPMDGGNEKPKF